MTDWALDIKISSTKSAFEPSDPTSKAVEPIPLSQMLALPTSSPDINMSGTRRVRSFVSLTPASSSISPEKACNAEGTSNKFCSLF